MDIFLQWLIPSILCLVSAYLTRSVQVYLRRLALSDKEKECLSKILELLLEVQKCQIEAHDILLNYAGKRTVQSAAAREGEMRSNPNLPIPILISEVNEKKDQIKTIALAECSAYVKLLSAIAVYESLEILNRNEKIAIIDALAKFLSVRRELRWEVRGQMAAGRYTGITGDMQFLGNTTMEFEKRKQQNLLLHKKENGWDIHLVASIKRVQLSICPKLNARIMHYRKCMLPSNSDHITLPSVAGSPDLDLIQRLLGSP